MTKFQDYHEKCKENERDFYSGYVNGKKVEWAYYDEMICQGFAYLPDRNHNNLDDWERPFGCDGNCIFVVKEVRIPSIRHRVDYLLGNRKKELILEVKWQSSGGTAWEKIAQLVERIAQYNIPTIIGYGGSQLTQERMKNFNVPSKNLVGVYHMADVMRAIKHYFA